MVLIKMEKRTVKLELTENLLEAVKNCQKTYNLPTLAETVRHGLTEFLASRGFFVKSGRENDD